MLVLTNVFFFFSSDFMLFSSGLSSSFNSFSELGLQENGPFSTRTSNSSTYFSNSSFFRTQLLSSSSILIVWGRSALVMSMISLVTSMVWEIRLLKVLFCRSVYTMSFWLQYWMPWLKTWARSAKICWKQTYILGTILLSNRLWTYFYREAAYSFERDSSLLREEMRVSMWFSLRSMLSIRSMRGVMRQSTIFYTARRQLSLSSIFLITVMGCFGSLSTSRRGSGDQMARSGDSGLLYREMGSSSRSLLSTLAASILRISNLLGSFSSLPQIRQNTSSEMAADVPISLFPFLLLYTAHSFLKIGTKQQSAQLVLRVQTSALLKKRLED